MGAAGEYVLCGYGHVIGAIGDDLCWGEPEDESSVYKELERLVKSQCLKCGRIAKYQFYHYGDINDCLDEDSKLELSGNRYIIPDKIKPNLNMNVKTLPGLTDELVTLIIMTLEQSDLKIVHKSQIGRITLPQVSEEYLHNLIMNR